MNYDPDQPYEQIPFDATGGQSQPPAPSGADQPTPAAANVPAYTNPSFYNQPAQPVPPGQPYPPPVAQPMPMVQPPYQAYQPYMPPPQFQPQPPQPRKSRKWLWITLSIIGGVILLGCIGCSILVATNFGTVKQVFEPAFVTGEYYAAVQQQQYSTAYKFLADNASITIDGQRVQDSETAFVQAAISMDTKYGPVTQFSVQTADQNFNQLQIQVTRKHLAPYIVTLTFETVNGSTKIASISNI